MLKNLSRTRILYTVAVAAVLAPLSQLIFVPSIVTIREEFQATNVLIGATLGVHGAGLMAAQFFYGALSDRFAGRRILLIALSLYVLFSFATFWSTGIYQLILLRGLQALMTASAQVVGPALIADHYAPWERGRAIGTFQSVVGMGPVLGPFFGTLIFFFAGWRFVFLFLALVGSGVVIMSWLSLPDAKARAEPLSLRKIKHLFASPAPLGACLLAGAEFFLLHGFSGLLPVLFKERAGLDERWIGFALVVLALFMAIGAPWGGRMADQWGRRFTMLVGVGAASVFLGIIAALAFLPTPQVILFGMVPALCLLGFSIGFATASQISLVLDWFPEMRATAMAMYNTGRHMGTFIGPLTVGVLMDAFGVSYGFLAPAAVVTGAALVAFVVVRDPQPDRSGDGQAATPTVTSKGL